MRWAGEIRDAQCDSHQIVRSCWWTLDRVTDMLGRIYSHTFSFGFGWTFVVTCNDLYIEPGAGLRWHLARMALQVGDELYNLGLGPK